MKPFTRDQAHEAVVLINRIRPILAGHPPTVQGAALADLVATWLAGHDIPGDAAETRHWRAELLSLHCSAVRELVPVNAKIIGTTE